jgi:hypothetical protein
MKTEMKLGLLAAGIVVALAGCCALVVALCLVPGSTDSPKASLTKTAALQPGSDARGARSQADWEEDRAGPDASEDGRREGDLPSRPRLQSPREEEFEPLPAREEVRPVPVQQRGPKQSSSSQQASAVQPAQQAPEFDSFKAGVREARLDKQRKSGETEPIEIIRAFLTDQLASGEVLKIRIYSDPIRAVYKRKRAAVLRVVYDVQRPKEPTRTRDELFLLQEGEVRQWVDFAEWAALMRRKLEMLAAQQRAAQQAIAAQLAQQQAAQQSLAGQLSQRPRHC